MKAAIFLIEVGVLRLDDKSSAFRHGVPCIEAEVHQNLVNLNWVRHRDAKVRRRTSLLQKVIGENIEVAPPSAGTFASRWRTQFRLTRFLMNLCLNARDAMPKGDDLSSRRRTPTSIKNIAAFIRLCSPGTYVFALGVRHR